ncbi:WHG domain-containing protein [Methylobacterium sp. NEAU 140]|uniref:WHG domain-containing protein n=1 Tax=Methylobacterium sp. NEAU 140 TaxID=3064945 RepID=UPI002733CF21|nr:WHG domain-containing protein [Methylobacterium sp. NEAU 140]MDP4023316.1 WHG domain-containing protein [Methylobacterium sp. NEAU 140]
MDLVAAAAEDLVRAEGVRALGMRRLAAAIGYAPNSIYNAVGDLDHVVLRVNARSLDRLGACLEAARDPEAAPRANAAALAEAYLGYVRADGAVWSLVHAHAFAPDTEVPDWHAQALARALAPVDATLAPLVPDATERRGLVTALWAALHGLAALATSGRLAGLGQDRPEDLARLLVGRVLDGS